MVIHIISFDIRYHYRRPNNSQIAPALKDVMTDVCYAKSRDACRKGNERGPS